MKFQNPSFNFFLTDGQTDEQTNRRTSRKQYAPNFFKVGRGGGGGHNKSCFARRPVFGFLTRSNTKLAVDSQKMSRGMKFWT